MKKRWTALVFVSLLAAGAIAAQTGPRDVDLTAADGIKLKATYYPAAKPGPGILLLHQCNGDRKGWASLAQLLAAAGFHVLALDYRGFGESGGDRYLELPADRIGEEGAKWPGDIDVAFDYLRSRPGVDRQRIGAGGASCGVNQSVELARRHPEVKTIVLLSGSTHRDGRAYLQQAAGMPLLGAASDDDGSAVQHMEWLLDFSANPHNRFLHYHVGGHGTQMFAANPGLPPAIVKWFRTYLPNASTRPPTEVKASALPVSARKTKAGISSAEFFNLLETPEGAARALAVYEEARRKDPDIFLFPETEVNELGYRLMPDHPRHAIDVLKLNVAAFPDSANAYDSLADAYAAAGETALAIEYAEKTLETLRTHPPNDPNVADLIRRAAEHKLQELRPRRP